MSALIILVSNTPRTLRHAEAVLSERNHLVAALSSSDEAHVLLDSVTPDLLIADLRPGDYADLQVVVRSRVDHPDVPVIVTSAEPDEIAASEARRLGATFIVSPLDNPAFLPAVDEAIATRRRDLPPVRRWFRAPELKSNDWQAATGSPAEDFKRIPQNHPRSHVLASVPGTPSCGA